jgi:glycosyltransferase involved in cell wall biosynthesis
VCTGTETDSANFASLARKYGVGDLVLGCGFVPPEDLKAIYGRATMLVFPSLFEGWGMPITEAFDFGVPVAASRVTCIPEIVGDAAALFDPHSVDDITNVLASMWRSDALLFKYAEAGRIRGSGFSWDKTGSALAGVYRDCVGREKSASNS